MQTQQVKEACLPNATSLLREGMFVERLHYVLRQCKLELLE